MEQISSKILKSRKEHTCDFCNGKIQKGENYRRQCNKVDEVYTWKNHIHCEEICSALKMHDYADDYGVNEEDFQITIREEYKNLMSIHQSEIYEYEHFQYPDFQGQLKYVCEMHKVEFLETKQDK